MQPEIRIQAQTKELEARWQQEARWAGIERTYTAADVVRLRGSVVPESTLARYARNAQVNVETPRARRPIAMRYASAAAFESRRRKNGASTRPPSANGGLPASMW